MQARPGSDAPGRQGPWASCRHPLLPARLPRTSPTSVRSRERSTRRPNRLWASTRAYLGATSPDRSAGAGRQAGRGMWCGVGGVGGEEGDAGRLANGTAGEYGEGPRQAGWSAARQPGSQVSQWKLSGPAARQRQRQIMHQALQAAGRPVQFAAHQMSSAASAVHPPGCSRTRPAGSGTCHVLPASGHCSAAAASCWVHAAASPPWLGACCPACWACCCGRLADGAGGSYDGIVARPSAAPSKLPSARIGGLPGTSTATSEA